MPNSLDLAINFQTTLDTNYKISTLQAEIINRKFGKFPDCTSNSFFSEQLCEVGKCSLLPRITVRL